MTLPQSTIDRIRKEAEEKYPKRVPEAMRKMTNLIIQRDAEAYVRGAESEAMRAQELVEALKMCYQSLCTYGEHPIIDKAVEQALENYGE